MARIDAGKVHRMLWTQLATASGLSVLDRTDPDPIAATSSRWARIATPPKVMQLPRQKGNDSEVDNAEVEAEVLVVCRQSQAGEGGSAYSLASALALVAGLFHDGLRLADVDGVHSWTLGEIETEEQPVVDDERLVVTGVVRIGGIVQRSSGTAVADFAV